MKLSHPQRRERLDKLAAEYALGTSPLRVRRRLEAVARRDRVVARALSDWERRLAGFADAVPPVAPAPRVWQGIVGRLGLDDVDAPRKLAWWKRLAVWQSLAAASLAVIALIGALEWRRAPPAPPATLVVVLAGADAKPALIATALRGESHLTVKRVGNATPEQGNVYELWALPEAGPPQPLGVIPSGNIARVPFDHPVDERLSNISSLAVSVEPPGGSPTGKPTGPVLFSGSVERMY
ncbi:MAG TPA: anti-sigma factor [Casimicrobiaceae bacterium]|nr:anti-sigma factor [Casimicrobiaceae bacterium]